MDRLQKLKERLFDGFSDKIEWWGRDLTIWDQSGVEKLSLIERKAVAFEMVCLKMPVVIHEHELIVGATAMASMIGFGDNFPIYETKEEAAQAALHGLGRNSVVGHHLPHYNEVLSKGYTGIIADIDRKLSSENESDEEKRTFWRAARYTLTAAMKVSTRYAALAKEIASSEKHEQRKIELEEIIRICEKVPAHPAESLHEALQSVWFVHSLLQSTITKTPLGRLDQILYPYYAKDIEENRITREQAEELIGCFLIKFNERVQLNHEDLAERLSDITNKPVKTSDTLFIQRMQNANHWLQSLTVSGKNMDGSDATNEISYMIIRQINHLELVSPMVNARLHSRSPKNFIDFIGDNLCDGGAQPVVFNDDVIIPGLIHNCKYPAEEAYDYASDGCWEVLIFGRTEFDFRFVHLLHQIEALFNHGKSMQDDREIGIDMGNVFTELDSFDKFYDAFLKQVKHTMDTIVDLYIHNYKFRHTIAPEPFLSTMVLDCIENGHDITDKGARYRLYGLMATGLSHAVDSLNVIRTLVYDEKKVTLNKLYTALKANWEGYEILQQAAMNRIGKYGNDCDQTDDLLVRFVKDFCDYADEINRRYDWCIIAPGIATFESYPLFGFICAASADGRFNRESLSSNYSPAVGRDVHGATAALLSSAKPDLSRMTLGCPVDIRISFSKQNREENARLLSDLVNSFIAIRGCMLTISRVDIETLKKAQINPEQYKSLRVRLGGVTAYFVQLAKEQQNEYMRRTEHKL